MYSKFSLLLAALLAAVIWVGCDDDRMADLPDGTDPVGSIQIVTEVPNDTLKFFDDDSVSIRVTVIVTDTRGLAYPGQKVDMSISDLNLGIFEYVDDELQDTTNALGRIVGRFHAYGNSGTLTISARSSSITANAVLALIEVPPGQNSLTFVISDGSSDTLYVPAGGSDSLRIRVAVYDANGNPPFDLNGVYLSSEVTGGELESFPPLFNGGTEGWWVFHDTYGAFRIRVYRYWSIPIPVLPDTTG